jgi:predicted nucleotidyltransferase
MESNDWIYEKVKAVFSEAKIKFLYLCGSHSYGTQGEDSDIDIAVVLDNFKGSIHLEIGELDVFAFGTDTFLLKQMFDPSIPHYYLASVDEVLSIDRNMIFLDERYRYDFEAYKTVDIKKNLKRFLESFIQYHQMRLDENLPKKTHYHILRMRGTLDHLDRTGHFEHVIEEPWRSIMLDYKKNWMVKGHEYMDLIKEQMAYIKAYKEKVTHDELGKHNQSL